MRKLLIIVLILIAIPILWFKWSFPTVTYRYRLNVTVEADGKTHAESTVIEVWHRFNPGLVRDFVGSPADGGVRGQGVFIDLGARGALVTGLGMLPYDTCAVPATDLVRRAYEPPAAHRPCTDSFPLSLDEERALSQKRGRIALTPDVMPPFFWFSDPTNLATARPVAPDSFASVIGDSVHLVSAEIEVTQEPVTLDIKERVPACSDLDKAQTNLSIKCSGFVVEGD